jgi:protein SCO1/2
MSSRRRIALAAGAAVLLAAVALVVAVGGGRGGRPPASGSAAPARFDGAALPGTVPAPSFKLFDQRGQSVSPSHFHGQVTVIAFVTSDCGAPCVLVAQQIRGALDELGRPVPVLLISADPAADTPASIGRFLASVSLAGRARYLTGPLPALRRIWRAYGVHPPSGGRAEFERSLSVLLLDRDGHERVVFGLEQLTPEGLAHDIRALR